MALAQVLGGVTEGPQLDFGHIPQSEKAPVLSGPQDNVLVLFDLIEPAPVFQHVFEGPIGVFPDLSGGDLPVLFPEGGLDVGGDQVVGGHFVRGDPDPHGVILGPKDLYVPDPFDPLNLGQKVDFGIVLHKDAIVGLIGGIYRHEEQGGILPFGGAHPGLYHFLGQQAGGSGHPVLHVHRGNVRIDAQFKVDVDTGPAVVPGGGGHIGHALHPVDLFLQGNDHGIQDGLGIGPGIDGVDIDGGRRYFRVLFHGQGAEPQNAQDQNNDGNYRGENGTVYKFL